MICPTTSSQDIERWKSRSGTVKINLAVDRLPSFSCSPASTRRCTAALSCSPSRSTTSRRLPADAAAGRAAAIPFADICIPSVFDDSLAPAGTPCRVDVHPVGAAHLVRRQPHQAELDAYADRVLARMEAVAPGFTASVLHRQVIGPHTMENEYGLVGGNIFHGELSPGQMFHARPGRGLRRPADSRPGPLPGGIGDPRRRRRDRHPRQERGPPDPARRPHRRPAVIASSQTWLAASARGRAPPSRG